MPYNNLEQQIIEISNQIKSVLFYRNF